MAPSGRPGPGPFLLKPGVQFYAWGDRRFIPRLLGLRNGSGRPHAELWMGAHPDLPSTALLEDGPADLRRLLEKDPAVLLGAEGRGRKAGFPYLFKVLSAAGPLSLQVHPTAEKAARGFAREERAGVPPSSPLRRYKDPNPKPELVAALTDFYALRGFRPLPELARTLRAVPELRPWAAAFRPTPEHLKRLYAGFMTAPQERVDAVLTPLVRRLARGRPFPKDRPEHWILRADRQFSRGGRRDRGLLSLYLLNLVRLRPGEALFLPPGTLHSYLEGSALELMTNSNNVLRGGLTAKPVDVPALLDNVVFEGRRAEVLRPRRAGPREWAYPAPAREFELRRVDLSAGQAHEAGPDHGVEILIVLSLAPGARLRAVSPSRTLALKRGSVFLVPRGVPCALRSTGRAVLYKAAEPRP